MFKTSTFEQDNLTSVFRKIVTSYDLLYSDKMDPNYESIIKPTTFKELHEDVIRLIEKRVIIYSLIYEKAELEKKFNDPIDNHKSRMYILEKMKFLNIIPESWDDFASHLLIRLGVHYNVKTSKNEKNYEFFRKFLFCERIIFELRLRNYLIEFQLLKQTNKVFKDQNRLDWIKLFSPHCELV